ncbi:MAG: asparagine synthase-related protein [Planctomycetota bacterium]
MDELESSLHLYQLPLYRGTRGDWRRRFLDAVGDCEGKLTWDPAAILSLMSFGYVCGDRTLINEVHRRPWLSTIGPDNEPRLEEIPQHGRLWQSFPQIAEHLCELLCNEAMEVCKGRREIYILLSGGLDSRVVAAVLAKLRNENKIETNPIGVTWGLEGSRDVVYGRMAAEILGFKWIHLNIDYTDVLFNTKEMAIAMGTLASPVHLHCMHWFQNVPKDAIVLAGSYGDSVGRAEFSGQHFLELNYLRPKNFFGLIRQDVLELAYSGVVSDLKQLRERTPGRPKYVRCEHEMQGHYMRGLTAHAMSVIGQYCSIYQMFTHPKTYSYMWSIHPALRYNNIYAELLEKLNHQIARMPWARTNRSLKGKTVGAKRGLARDFHHYAKWISGPLYDEFHEYVDSNWFAATGIFDRDRVRNLSREVVNLRTKESIYGFSPCEKWLWLVAFRFLAEHLESMGNFVEVDKATLSRPKQVADIVSARKSDFARQLLNSCGCLYRLTKRYLMPCIRMMRKRIVRKMLNLQAIWKYPPTKNEKIMHVDEVDKQERS